MRAKKQLAGIAGAVFLFALAQAGICMAAETELETELETAAVTLKLDGTYETGEKGLFTLYRVGGFSGNSFYYFKNVSDQAGELGADIYIEDFQSDLGTVAKNLEKLIKETDLSKELEAVVSGKLNADHTITFEDLPPGIWLAVQTAGEDLFTAKPVLMNLPHLGYGGGWNYGETGVDIHESEPRKTGAILLTVVDAKDREMTLAGAKFIFEERVFVKDAESVPENAEIEESDEGAYFWQTIGPETEVLSDENGCVAVNGITVGASVRITEIRSAEGHHVPDEGFWIVSVNNEGILSRKEDGTCYVSSGNATGITLPNEEGEEPFELTELEVLFEQYYEEELERIRETETESETETETETETVTPNSAELTKVFEEYYGKVTESFEETEELRISLEEEAIGTLKISLKDRKSGIALTGAEFVVTDERNSSVAKNRIASDGSSWFSAEDLTDGLYYLVERKTPYGYARVEKKALIMSNGEFGKTELEVEADSLFEDAVPVSVTVLAEGPLPEGTVLKERMNEGEYAKDPEHAEVINEEDGTVSYLRTKEELSVTETADGWTLEELDANREYRLLLPDGQKIVFEKRVNNGKDGLYVKQDGRFVRGEEPFSLSLG